MFLRPRPRHTGVSYSKALSIRFDLLSTTHQEPPARVKMFSDAVQCSCVDKWTGFFCLVSFDVRVCPLSPQSSFGRGSTAYIITYKCRSEEQKHQNEGSCHRYILLQHSHNTDTVAVDAVEELQPELIWRDVIFSWILHCSCQANSVSMQHDWSGGRPQTSGTETSEVS